MTTMLERVARALCEADSGLPYAGSRIVDEADWHSGMVRHVANARAAIQARKC